MSHKLGKKIIVTSVLIAVLFLSAIAGTVLYYSGEINDDNSKIVSLSAQIANQNDEISNLTSQIPNLNNEITNMTAANLVATLSVSEDSDPFSGVRYLTITGDVSNIGEGAAYNAGLHVVAYTNNGTLAVNATVSLGYQEPYNSFGIQSSPSIYEPPYSGAYFVTGVAGESGPAQIYLYINHANVTVTSWTVTPVWTNTP